MEGYGLSLSSLSFGSPLIAPSDRKSIPSGKRPCLTGSFHSVLAAIGQDIVPHLFFRFVYPEMALAEEIGIQIEQFFRRAIPVREIGAELFE